MNRTLIAYLLTTIMLSIAAAGIAYIRYHSHERTYRRLKRNERALRKLERAR